MRLFGVKSEPLQKSRIWHVFSAPRFQKKWKQSYTCVDIFHGISFLTISFNCPIYTHQAHSFYTVFWGGFKVRRRGVGRGHFYEWVKNWNPAVTERTHTVFQVTRHLSPSQCLKELCVFRLYIFFCCDQSRRHVCEPSICHLAHFHQFKPSSNWQTLWTTTKFQFVRTKFQMNNKAKLSGQVSRQQPNRVYFAVFHLSGQKLCYYSVMIILCFTLCYYISEIIPCHHVLLS